MEAQLAPYTWETRSSGGNSPGLTCITFYGHEEVEMHLELALQRAAAGKGPAIDFSGNWKNELHSRMTIIQRGTSLSGSYTSKVSATGNETTGTLVGFVDGDLIAFSVHWDDFQAITSWVGQSLPHAAVFTLRTLWQMVKQVADGEEWSSVNAGTDDFVRIT